MTGNIRAMKLHVMESVECDLSCAGCYLKQPISGGFDWIELRHQYLNDVQELDEIGSAFYLNNLTRGPATATGRYHKTIQLLEQIFHPKTVHKALVTDSINAAQLESEDSGALKDFDEFWASCRNLSSVKHLINSTDRKWGFLYTIGTDSTSILDFLMDMPDVPIDLNIRKPYTVAEMLSYHQILEIGLRLKPGKIRGDNCMQYRQNKRDCSKPEGFIELTTFLDGKKRFHLCAYPSDECKCKIKSGAKEQ